MQLNKLKLRNFRNYENQELKFRKRFNFIFGDNGQGKTNILEAISFLTFGKSFLGSTEQDCVKFGNIEFQVDGNFENEIESSFDISLNYSSELKKKSYQLNKEKVSRFSSEVFGKFPVVFFSPHSLNITYGNPSERRRFFDILISQTSKLYLDYLKDLSRLLKQKNALLKNNLLSRNYSESDFLNLLNSYNESLIDVSAEIIFRRLTFLNEFKTYFEHNFSNLISGESLPVINYFSEMFDGIESFEINSFKREDVLLKTKKCFDEKQKDEIMRGISLIGPQRDDYIFILNKKELSDEANFEMKNFASQGEHKTFVLALKLAEYYYIKDKVATSPILLLDDILSELDSSRVLKIMSHLNDFGQIFLTSTERNYFDELKKLYNRNEISLYKIENGNAEPKEN